MPFFSSLKERLWGFVSPRRTLQKRDAPLKARPHKPVQKVITKTTYRALAKRLDRRSMSPNTRVKNWRITSRTPDSLSPPSAYTRSQSHTDNDNASYFVDSDWTEKESVWETTSVNANDDSHVVPEDKYEEERKKRRLQYDAEIARREANAIKLRRDGWPEEAIALITQISMRGLKPLLPLHWAKDFDTFPAELFTPDNSLPFIKALRGNDFRAMLALRDLVDLGPKVRDRIIAGRDPEPAIVRAVAAYAKWAHDDAALPAHALSNLALSASTVSNPPSPIAAEEDLLAQLAALTARYRALYRVHPSVEMSTSSLLSEELVRPLPTLYGLVADFTQMAFVCYDTAADAPTLKPMACFDWANARADVWNSFAVAILVVHCRNRLVALGGEVEWAGDEERMDEEDDPDL